MNILKKKSLAIATFVYWFLLLYIVAALVYWFIVLYQQNQQMTGFKLIQVKPGNTRPLAAIDAIIKEEQRKTTQYVSEGIAFLLVIMIGAVFVYRAVRRQFMVSQQQQNFMMAITHELKTPIATTKLNLETMQRHRLDEQKQQKLLHMTLQETERLNALANNILISSQLEGGGYQVSKEELDLSSLAAGCVHDFSHRFAHHRWIIDIQPDLAITGDTLLLQIMINNLLDNAIKYSPKESSITFRLKQNRQAIELSVIDNGPGIADREKKKIFDRFYRVGNESVRTAKGTGLGLYLCKKIAADHRAEIMVTDPDHQLQGSDFTIRFKT